MKKIYKLKISIYLLLLLNACARPCAPNSKNTPQVMGIMDTMTIIFEGRITTPEKIGLKNAKVEIAHFDRPNQKTKTTTDDKGWHVFKHISGGCYNMVIYHDLIQTKKLKNIGLYPSHIMKLNITIKTKQ